MSTKPKAWLAWSSGKDSAWALYQTQLEQKFEITSLLTNITAPFQRIAMHAVREQLLIAQAEAVGIPLYTVSIPYPCSNEDYESAMTVAMADARKQGVEHIIFGDLYLEDVRTYREEQLKKVNMTAVFPLWQCPTTDLAKTMINQGLKAVLTCIDPRRCPVELAGSWYNQAFLSKLPTEVDPCGEGGEFHTFVYDGPMFKHAIPIKRDKTVERDGFLFTDIVLDHTDHS